MRAILLLCLFVLTIREAWAVPAVIGTPVAGNSGATATDNALTISATCPSGNSDVVAVACVSSHKAGSTAVSTVAVTWNGVTMTALASPNPAVETATNGSYANMFVLVNPTCNGSAHNLVMTPTTGNDIFLVGTILFLKDTHQTTPNDTPVADTAVSAAITSTVPSATTDLVVDCVAARNSLTNLSVSGTGQTLGALSQTTNATDSSNEEGAMSYEAGATSVTMSWADGATSVSSAHVSASFNPAVTARRRFVPPRRYLQLFKWFTPSVWATIKEAE